MSALGELGSLRGKKPAGHKKDNLAAYLFLTPWLLGLFLITIGPMLASLYLSFTDYNLIQAPKWIGLENFTRMLSDERLHNSLRVTFTYVFVSVPLQLAIALLLAVVLDRGVRRPAHQHPDDHQGRGHESGQRHQRPAGHQREAAPVSRLLRGRCLGVASSSGHVGLGRLGRSLGLAQVVPRRPLGRHLGVVGRAPVGVEQDLGGLVVDPEPTIGRVEVGDRAPPRRPDLVGRRGGVDVEHVVPVGVHDQPHDPVTGA